MRAGSENNPVGKGGIATLTASSMGEATTSRDLTALARHPHFGSVEACVQHRLGQKRGEL